jgi:hypothetical protein
MQQQQHSQHSHLLACPRCQSDQQVQKVSVLVASGTVNGISHGYYWGRTGGWFSGRNFHGTTMRWHYQQTALAKRLAPPRKPANVAALFTGLGVFCFALPLLCGCPPTVAAASIGAVGSLLALMAFAMCIVPIIVMI